MKKWENLCKKLHPKRPGYYEAKKYAKMAGMRSMAEVELASMLSNYKYEPEYWVYQYEKAKYTPDFLINGVYLEVKGKMTNDTRKKLKAVIKHNPSKILVLVFLRGKNYIRKGSKTTYINWANKENILNFDFSDLSLLTEYLNLNSGKEKWKILNDFSCYYVSSYGRLLNKNRNTIVKPSNSGKGYLLYHLRCNNKKRDVCAHTLVLEHFWGPAKKGYECNHKDGNKKNNNINNLEWVTKSENHKHAFLTGLNKPPGSFRGSKHPLTKLTEKQVLLIRELYKDTNLKQIEIAKLFNVHKQVIYSIINRKTWTHI